MKNSKKEESLLLSAVLEKNKDRFPSKKLEPIDFNTNKNPTFPIPIDTFGKKIQYDKENAKQVLGGWKENTPQRKEDMGTDYQTLNKLSVKAHAVNPAQVKVFRKSHDIRLRKEQKHSNNSIDRLPSDNNSNFRYGIKSAVGDTAKDLIELKFENDWLEQQLETYIKRTKKKKQVDIVKTLEEFKQKYKERKQQEKEKEKELSQFTQFLSVSPNIEAKRPKQSKHKIFLPPVTKYKRDSFDM
ncbi:hypothetical protein ABK040_010406 [Willaertia magna]